MSEKLNPFAIAQAQLDEAAAVLQLDPDMHAFLREPMREFHFTIPVRMDDGNVRTFRGFRVQYNDARGPGKGPGGVDDLENGRRGHSSRRR
jgi:glutamate dehydrogenase (NAD(P)+)